MKCPVCNNDMEKDDPKLMYPYYCKKCHGYWDKEGISNYLNKNITSKSNQPNSTAD